MSGFVGIVHLEGSPVDPGILRDLTDLLVFRGPDAQEIWCDGPVGLGHTLLHVKSGKPLEKQPTQIEDRLWIVSDARIDSKTELVAELNEKRQTGHTLSSVTPDAELILRAYDLWGEACVEHLLGDFSFAIWDAGRRRLFCARDHFGIKPFYYSHFGSVLVFSNTLNCVRRHPGVSNRLNEQAIADFLLFEANQDLATTSFSAIQRLPPARVLRVEQGAVLSSRRYWDLSVTNPIRYSRDSEYVEHFRELLDRALADRLTGETAGILMSGGLDSSTIAASAQRVFGKSGIISGLHAYTDVFDRLVPYEERHYATLVADHLKIPIEFIVNDDRRLFEHADRPEYRSVEPINAAWPDTSAEPLRRMACNTRVALTGFGGDPVLCGRISVHFRQLLENKKFGRTFADAIRYLTAEGRLGRLYLRTRWNLLFNARNQLPAYPPWLNETMEKHLSLRERWHALNQVIPDARAVRPEAAAAMSDPTWPNLFQGCDAGATHVPVEVCHPFFDLRVVRFLLALPRLPWCCDKHLLRVAGKGSLPDAVRWRRKSPMPADPLVVLLDQPESAWVDQFEAVPELAQYVVQNRIPRVHLEKDSWRASVNLRPLSLNFWLRGLTR